MKQRSKPPDLIARTKKSTMRSLNSSLLAEMIKSKRGNRGLRDTAKEIGTSSPTLSRIENGNLPDIDTYLKICKWLDVPSDYFASNNVQKGPKTSPGHKKHVIAHLRADKNLAPSTAEALIEMINLAYAKLNK